jgi:excisionase family DNA binding protein
MMTVKEVALKLKVSTRLIYALAGKKIPCFRIESALRFRKEDVDAYLDGCRGVSAAPIQEKPTTLRRLRI